MKKKSTQIIGGIVMVVFVLAIVFTITQISGMVTEVINVTTSKTPDAILASAGISEGMNVSLPVVYYDQKADECVDMYDVKLSSILRERQFEWSSCGYDRVEVEEGIVEKQLNEKYLPIASGGDLTPNKGINMKRWFEEVENKSKEYNGVLKMRYNATKSEFSFASNEFYPLDEINFSNGDFVNSDGHNHLFTMSIAIPFTALLSGEEEFEISADDDTFVFVGKDLVIDMGGIHDVTTRAFWIDREGDIYVRDINDESMYSGINIKEKRNSIIRVFHADRDSKKSVFGIKFSKMDLNVISSEIAEAEVEEMQIAYDPSDLRFTAPLGESLVLQPDNTEGKVVMATILGVVTLILSILLTSVVHFMFRVKGSE